MSQGKAGIARRKALKSFVWTSSKNSASGILKSPSISNRRYITLLPDLADKLFGSFRDGLSGPSIGLYGDKKDILIYINICIQRAFIFFLVPGWLRYLVELSPSLSLSALLIINLGDVTYLSGGGGGA